MRARVIENHWYPRMIGAEAVTLFPWVLLACPIALAIENRILQHEFIHVRQVRESGWIRFYVSYLFHYFSGRLNGLDHDTAYRRIPYEQEAYYLQDYYLGPGQDDYVIAKWI